MTAPAARTFRAVTSLAPLAIVLAVVACGGGGGGSGTAAAPAEATVSGSVVKGPVANATVTAYAVDAGAMGRSLGATTTDAQGAFSMALGDYSGPLMLRMAGGHFTNEATGVDMSMQAGDVMTAMIPSVSPAAPQLAVQVTPLTSMAQAMAQRMAGGMSAANMAAANASVGSYFMVSDILHVRPMDPLAPGSASAANADMRNYGMAMAAMSRLAGNLGMPNTSGMVTAMMQDASDGCMDGMMSGAPVMMGGGMMAGAAMPSFAGTSGMSNAMADFVRSPMNRSGLTVQDMQALINHLMTSSCSLH